MLVFRWVVAVVDRDCGTQLGLHFVSFDANHSLEYLQLQQQTFVLKEPKAKKITRNANGLLDPLDLLHHVEVGDAPSDLTDNLK